MAQKPSTKFTLNEAAAHSGYSSVWINQLHRTGRLAAERTAGGRGMRLYDARDIEQLRLQRLERRNKP
jgi:DNA-binding transcriptional MerR regulator